MKIVELKQIETEMVFGGAFLDEVALPAVLNYGAILASVIVCHSRDFLSHAKLKKTSNKVNVTTMHKTIVSLNLTATLWAAYEGVGFLVGFVREVFA